MQAIVCKRYRVWYLFAILSRSCMSQVWARDGLDPAASGFGHVGFMAAFDVVYYCWAISQDVCEVALPFAYFLTQDSDVFCASYVSIEDDLLFCFPIADECTLDGCSIKVL